MNLHIEPIPAFTDNYIWLLRRDNNPAVWVVDPGDAAPVVAVLEARDLLLEGILITHHHFDHTGGLPVLCERYSPLVLGPHNPATAEVQQRLGQGDRCEVLGLEFEVLEVPGHTLDHIALYSAEAEVLFCGDTLFAGGCGRVFEGTAAQMYASLDSLRQLPGATQVFCAHEYTLANLAFAEAVEPHSAELAQRITSSRQLRELGRATVPSTMALERATNPFLRCDMPAVVAAAQARKAVAGPVEVFAEIRNWKDNF